MRIFQYLGWDDHLYRLTLPHFDPTFTAVMLSLSVLYIYKTQYARLAIVYLPAIFLTYSRSVWLSLFAVGLIYAVQSKKYFKLLLAAVLLILVILIQPKKFGEGRNLLRVFSIESRVNHDLSYIGKYKWNLFAGRGMNTLVLDSSDSNTPNHATSPNNSYLYLLLTSGILGLAGWGMFMFDLFKKSTYKFMLIMFFVASLFNNVMFYPFALLSVFLVECQSNK
jgi:O-antigen ligase